MPTTAADTKNAYRQLIIEASAPDTPHAARCPSIIVSDRPNDARSRRDPLNHTVSSLTTGVHSMDCAAPLSAHSMTSSV